MKEPTKRQQEVMDFISGYINFHTYPPTVREIAEHFRISIKGAHDHILALKKKNLLKQGDKKSRTMGLVGGIEPETDIIEIPILGTVAAGTPIMAEENRDGSLKFHNSMFKKNRKYFALKIRGDSMEGAGIMDGDTAVIESRNNVRNGEIAVVLLDDSATLKTFYLENSRVRLQPENPNYSPIYCNRDLRILGRLAFVIRSYS
ncbi:MAG: transcriptional repressor LexA [Treponema sp.]|jgi:repressor LexA|nr:transcriptional repressor LexA [Treponema sp.]